LWGLGVLLALGNLDLDIVNNLGRLRTPNKVGMESGFNVCFPLNYGDQINTAIKSHSAYLT